MHRYKLLVQYDGTNYSGWQVQPDAVTVQQLLNENISKILQEKVIVTGSGRTDAGVHALGQVAHFDSDKELDSYKFLKSVNGLLPHDIRVMEIEKVDSDFHALFSAQRKEYHYRLSLNPYRNPLDRHFSTHIKHKLDLDLLKQAATKFVGTHDFTSFANSATEGAAAKNAVRTILRIDVVDEEGGVRLEFEGTGFLYKMVRNITGMLIDVARGKRDIHEIETVLKAKDRKLAAKAAPAQGLTLIKVSY